MLIEAGYRWDQFRILEMLGFGALGVGVLVLAPFMHAGHSPEAGVATAAAGFAMLAGLAWVVKRPRMIVFTRDGRVLAPNGIADRFWVRNLGPIADVSSIELTSSCRDFGVVLFTTEGRTILLAERMRKADARLVAVQLTKALHEMRQSLATIGSRSGRTLEAVHGIWVH
jgi:hypothetical protein